MFIIMDLTLKRKYTPVIIQNAENMSMIRYNDKAIPFSMDDYLGNRINLTAYRGKRVLLSFFRWASCPFCNLRIRQLIKTYPEFEKRKIEIITFFAASKEEIAAYAGKQHAPFPIIPDRNLEMYVQYGIEASYSGMFKSLLKPLEMIRILSNGFFNIRTMHKKPILPADFLIDENQYMYRVYYGKDFGDHLPIEDVLEWKK
jgi:thioredoxin-dependent peroxiredoxin